MRRGGPLGSPPPQATTTTAKATAAAARSLLRKLERMLEQNRRRQRVDVAASSTRRPFHLADGALRCSRREALIDISDGKAGATGDLGSDIANFARPRRIL